jgi:hypothetical protein
MPSGEAAPVARRDVRVTGTGWNTVRGEKENAVPGQYQDDVITASYPERGGMWVTGWGAGDENKCRDPYDELASALSALNERESTNWTALQDNATEIREMLEQGPTKADVQKLINAGHADWSFYSIDPGRYTMRRGCARSTA